MAAQYELLKELLNSGTKLSFGQDFFFKFYQAFILKDRWMQYISGVGTTLLVTALALALGVVLGSVVALVRVTHDQQRPGHKNAVLGFFNAVCQVYTTIIRGTPMMVQLLIMSMVIFANSRNFTMVGALTLGINSGAYVSEIIRGGLMAVDPGQMEAGRSLGLNYMTTMVVIIIPQAIRAVLPALGNEFIILLKDTSLITTIGGKELLYAAQGIMNRTYEAMFPLLGVALIYLILVMLFTWLLSVSIKGLSKEMAAFEKDIYGYRYQPEKSSIKEVSGLSESFGVNVKVVQDLLREVETKQRELHESHLEILRNQINPHFLYNTLDSIVWMCKMGKADEAAEMTSALAKLFRVGISRGKKLILVAKEAEHAESYLKIQSMRFKSKFDYTMDILPEALACRCNKIILQPFIENSIKHGIIEGEKLHISVKGRVSAKDLILTVADDGCGMSAAVCLFVSVIWSYASLRQEQSDELV